MARAVAFCSFDELRAQEEIHGFSERPSQGRPFFRGGRVGDWRAVLTAEQVRDMVGAHGSTMRRFGYLINEGGR